LPIKNVDQADIVLINLTKCGVYKNGNFGLNIANISRETFFAENITSGNRNLFARGLRTGAGRFFREQ
jgi:hypothetical protein